MALGTPPPLTSRLKKCALCFRNNKCNSNNFHTLSIKTPKQMSARKRVQQYSRTSISLIGQKQTLVGKSKIPDKRENLKMAEIKPQKFKYRI